MTAQPDPRAPGASLDFASRTLGVPYPSFPDLLPEGAVGAGRYTVRFARSVEDLDAIQRLPFEIFNQELGEGLDSAFQTGRDEDDLDPHFHHLLISCGDPAEVVGTYRLQTAEMAARRAGFYSAGEFDLTGLPAEFLAGAVEVGRACVARGHRNGRVVVLPPRARRGLQGWHLQGYRHWVRFFLGNEKCNDSERFRARILEKRVPSGYAWVA